MTQQYYYDNFLFLSYLGHTTYNKYGVTGIFKLRNMAHMSIYWYNGNFETIDGVYYIRSYKNMIVVNRNHRIKLNGVKSILINNLIVYGEKYEY